MKWETKELGEIAQIVSGSTPKRNNSKFWDGEIFFATPKDLSNLSSKYLEKTANKITKEGLESCSTQILPINSILLSSRAPIGLVAITKVALCTNQGFKSLVLKNNISPDYVYYFLKASTKQLNALGRGATFKEISKKIVGKVQIPLPPLTEQRRIAAILDKADALRARTRAQLAAYDELLQAVFLDMFGDPVVNEKGWEKVKLKDVCERITDGTHHSPPSQEKGVPYITAKHLKNTGLDFFSNPTYISIEDHQKIYSRCSPKKGDVLYIKDGATTGLAAVNNYDFEFSMLSSLALIKPLKDRLNNLYLKYWLNAPHVKTYLTRTMSGAAIKRFTLTKIKAFMLPLPPLNLQVKFQERVNNIEHQKQLILERQQQSDDLFNSLLQRAFRGEL
jgi:type I restriction enzyme, S subunit